MIKILFLINSLNGGGAERVLVNLVNNMDKTHYDVTVQTIFPAGVNKEYLNSNARLIEGKIPAFKGISLLCKIFPKNTLKAIVSKDNYDVVVAYMHGLPTKCLWKYSNKAKKVAWLHCDMYHSSLHKFFSSEQIVKCFDTFDKIVGVSDSVCDSFSQMYGLDEKLVTIYNTNDSKRIRELSSKVPDRYDSWVNYDGVKLITVGRLERQKGYDRLINICRQLKEDNLKFKLLILGDGKERESLKNLASDNNLQDTVIFGGYNNNPYPYIKSADLFICSSRFEGLSTVMSETVILETPIITTNVSGASEVLGNSNEYGVVVENNTESLYEGLKNILSDSKKLQHYNNAVKNRALFFDTQYTVSKTEEFFKSLVEED